jgi:RES domain-containing protein
MAAGSVVAGFYVAESRETAWAEWYRQLGELAIRPEASLPRDLWRLEIDLEAVADLGDELRLARVGLSLPTPTRKEWTRFQAVGERLHKEGWAGLIAPSAARPRGRTLCLFRDTLKLEGVKPIPPPAIHRHPPALAT